jgi:hypothetical protein
MNRIKVTENFYLDELVPPEIYSQRGEKSIALLDMRIVNGLQHLRELANVPFTINNWINKGIFDERGLRLPNTRTGAKWSQHKYGRAIDIDPQGMSIAGLFGILKANEKYFIERQWITAIENIEYTRTWLHIDCRYTGLDHFYIVNP